MTQTRVSAALFAGRPTGERGRLRAVVATGVILLLLAGAGTMIALAVVGRSVRAAEPSAAAVPPSSGSVDQNATVATIDGIPVPMREFQIFLDQERANTIEHFQSTAHAQVDDTFWTTSFSGVTPAHYLLTNALSDAQKTTVQLELAATYKITGAPQYATFLASLAAENARRRGALAAGQPIYGPKQYSEANYLGYVVGQYGYELQQRLVADGTIQVTDDDLHTYFQANKATLVSTAGSAEGLDSAAFTAQLRQYVIADRYTQLVGQLSQHAATIEEAPFRQLESSQCLMTGGCSGN